MGGLHSAVSGLSRKITIALCSLFLIGAGFAVTTHSAHAATLSLTVNALLPDGAGAASREITIRSGAGTVTSGFTNTSGVATFSIDTATLGGIEFLEVALGNPPEGYVMPSRISQTVELATGLTQTVTFNYRSATKTINVTVVDDGGNLVDADMSAALVGDELQTGFVTESISGTGDIQTADGGTWVVKADANLSEPEPHRYMWMATGGGIVVEFAKDDSIESRDITFTVQRANALVSLELLDADGQPLLADGFQADITLTGYSPKYGAMSTSRKVNNQGILQVFLLPGIWTVSAFTSQLDNQSYRPEDVTFVLPDFTAEEETAVDWGTVTAVENTSSLSGTAHLIGGETPQDVTIVITNVNTGSHSSTNLLPEGTWNIENLGPGEYSISFDVGVIPVSTTTATITGQNQTISGLEIQAADADITISGSLLEDGATRDDLPAMVRVESNGHQFVAPVDSNGTYSLALSSDLVTADEVQIELVPLPGADAFADPITQAIAPDSGFEANIELRTDEATVSGQIATPGGADLSSEELGEFAQVTAINVDTGAVESTYAAADGTWSMDVAPGTWTLIPEITDGTGITSVASKTTVNLDASEQVTDKAIPVFVPKGEATGVITDPDGEPVAEVPVLFTNLPALVAEAAATGEPINQNQIISISTSTDSDGAYAMGLPNGDFTVYTGSNPDMGEFMEPVAKEITIAGDDVSTDMSFRTAAATVSGEISQDGIESASVTVYAPEGGTETFDVAIDGTFSGAIKPGEYQYVASGVKDGELWTDEGTITATSGDTTLEPTLTTTGVEFPAAVAVEGSAMSPISVSNTAGANVTLPPYSAAFEGMLTVELSPSPEVTVVNGVAQVGLAYDVNVINDDGFELTQLNRDATVTLPIDPQLAQSAESTDLIGGTYQSDLGAFDYTGVIADANDEKMVIHTSHFSRFAVTTASAALTPNSPRQLAASKIKETSAKATWKKPKTSTTDSYTIQVREFKDKKQKHWTTYTGIQSVFKKLKSLDTATKYQVRVKACNTHGCSNFTQWEKFTTKTATGG